MQWLLDTNFFQAMQAALASGGMPNAEQQAEYEARDRSDSGVLTVAGDKAQIEITGVLTQKPDLFARWFGGGNTTYAQITAALADAEQDPTVTEITLAIDSPGGSISGLFDTLAALENVTKPMRAVAHNVCASAAYAIASQADSIIAANRASRVGSIGVAATFFVSDNKVSVTSTEAPLKVPDVRTVEGQAAVRDELDALHEVFVDAVAKGRKIEAATVNADFGRGATVLAEEAERRGMIDGVRGVVSEGVASGGEQKTEAEEMDIKTLRESHPEVYAEVFDLGATAERDRVEAHLVMGEASGDLKTAHTAIADGSVMTEKLRSQYLAAGLNRRDIEARQADDPEVAAGDGAAAPIGEADGEKVAAVVAEALGLED
ncbi:MAG: hypothetical protein DRP01_08285 [Archaeoglobales archaeon]|nr:MAG: hypothetical protein DRP01_08285 [Archaeoglobales archaeon]